MVPGMVANDIALLEDVSHDLWVLLNLASDAEECCWHAIPLKHIEYLWSKDGLRSIVERQGNDSRYAPRKEMIL
jgi:hypothetical protein